MIKLEKEYQFHYS